MGNSGVTRDVYYPDPVSDWAGALMQDGYNSHLQVEPENPGSGPEERAVLDELEEVLSSKPFRTSKQCQDLLKYVVRHTLDHDESGLRERVIGVEVFGRSPDYDTSDDPVVRMRASDVRKRLAQYSQTVPQPGRVVIELKPGSYRATFRVGERHAVLSPSLEAAHAIPEMPGGEAAAVRPESRLRSEREGGQAVRRLRWWWLAAVLIVCVSGGLGWRMYRAEQVTYQRRFWAPLREGRRPTLVFVGSNVAYTLRPSVLERYQAEHGQVYVGPEFFPELPSATVPSSDLLRQDHTFVTVGDLVASSKVVSLLSRWAQPFLLRSGQDVSIGDLRESPSVLIGGFNNRWTLETVKGLPFEFQDGTKIASHAAPARTWSVPDANRSENTTDYALISRVLHANTGGPVLALGGIGSFGTEAAAEFVTNEADLAGLLRKAPEGWETMNLQIVLQIKVVGYAPVSIEVVNATYW